MNSNKISNMVYQGERPLFHQIGLSIKRSKFLEGESALKECKDIEASECDFIGKYPLWNTDGAVIRDCLFTAGSRAAIWYSQNIAMTGCRVEAPKMFRECDRVTLDDVRINADECAWHCRGLRMRGVRADEGNYLGMHASDIDIERLTLKGNYPFQYVKNGEIRNSTLQSKDMLWNSENVTVTDSVLNGEYIGWYSKNLRLIRCRIISTQPLCYAENLTLEDCEMIGTDRCFERSTVDARVITQIDSVVYPMRGTIRAKSIGKILSSDPAADRSLCTIVTDAASGGKKHDEF